MGFLNGDIFIPVKQTMNVGARNLKAFREAFHTIREWQLQVLMLSALSSSATGAPTENTQHEPNTTMLAQVKTKTPAAEVPWVNMFFPKPAAKGSVKKSAVIKHCYQTLPKVLLK